MQRLGALNDEPYIREAIMKMAIRQVAWDMLATFDCQYELAEQLRLLGDLVEEHKPEADDG